MYIQPEVFFNILWRDNCTCSRQLKIRAVKLNIKLSIVLISN